MTTQLILGAGHVGRALLARWVAQGDRPFATARSEVRAAELARLGAQPILCDVLVPDTLAALPPVDVAVWSVGHDRLAGATIERVYVDGLRHALGHLRAARVLYTSSTGVYGPAHEEVDESTPVGPEDAGGRAVAQAEALLRAERPDAIILRLAGLYGKGRVIGRRAIETGAPIEGDPERWINFLHHEDAAAALALAAEKAPAGATYNVADADPKRRRDYYTLLARLLGRPPPEFVPRGPAGPGRIVRAEKLRAELGFALAFPSVEEGLPDALGA